MSTRCQIVVMENETTMYPVKIYKHCDGYPEGVLPTLEPFAQEFARDRGNDPEYMAAQIVRRFAVDGSRDSFTGWGLCTEWHGDIEYAYQVFPDGTVKAWSVRIPDNLPASSFPPGQLAGLSD